MPQSKAITDFQLRCQKYYICYSLASLGLREHAKKLSSLKPDRTKSLIVGTGHPDEGNWHGSMNIGEMLDASQHGGPFPDTIAKSFVSAIYSEWNELYRRLVANEAGVDQKSIKSDPMGDLRLIRHCIVHKKSVITDEPGRLREFAWEISPGFLSISEEMFCSLIGQINRMMVRVESHSALP